jgi:hypothetical protein
MRVGIVAVECDGPLQQLLCSRMLVGAHAPHVRHRLHDQIPCVHALRRLPLHARRLGHENLRRYRTNDAIRDVVLQREDVGQFAIVLLAHR